MSHMAQFQMNGSVPKRALTPGTFMYLKGQQHKQGVICSVTIPRLCRMQYRSSTGAEGHPGSTSMQANSYERTKQLASTDSLLVTLT